MTVEMPENEQIAQRQAKLATWRAQGKAYPNDFRRDSLAAQLQQRYGDSSAEELSARQIKVKLAGRLLTRRVMGKASFAHIQDMSGKIQLYLRRDELAEELYEQFLQGDLGDIIGIRGVVFKTKTGELSIKVASWQLLAKALLPLPEKFHGLVDQELRYRQRYLDLMVNRDTRRVFQLRSQLLVAMRNFFAAHSFLEVETPMMQPIPGGATARPFITHHNALDMELYLRIAPELYLKRLVVGGMERVFEINRNFRNEGISVRHNPEFTMVEFYQAYADYHDLMDFTEELLRYLAQEVLATTVVTNQGRQYDLARPFRRMTLMEAILHFNPHLKRATLAELEGATKIAAELAIPLPDNCGLGRVQYEIFAKTVEEQLEEPTFITSYPVEVSPLARQSDSAPFVTDRFELFIGGKELANGFSELNDPEEQAKRFQKQVAELAAGDMEAMRYDADYVTALKYGLPPTAGEGIGIDRLVMLFADVPSIRDVILFPTLRLKS